ncbi:GIY-YIG nuclease family protein [Bacillus xiapuensis]|uniref:GIY-YIG nuclease family protein n=1 Tax=Bacillus xiapuensis TaxID=2014075 RepID=UPI000C24AEB3|nr:GIY-YIG nuclease family protein [Bacillus xiapuensis]
MAAGSKHFFYVVECRDGSFYAGYTTNVEKRIQTHNAGKGAKYTRGRGPVRLVHAEMFSTVQEAMQAEYAFKQLTRKKKLEYLQKEGRCSDSQTKKLFK